ncbi:MAG: glycosyltransferase 87 family protein [Candidatus Acidiferrales bacterium]
MPLLIAGFVVLEAMFWQLQRYGDLERHVVETMAVGLAAGAFYLLVVYGLEHLPESRAAFWVILVAAILFRATLWPLVPTLSNDMYRYRWDGRVQLEGRNPYLFEPDDPELQNLRNPANSNEMRMPAGEIPTIYPPLAELVFRAAARFLPGTVAFKLPMEAADVLTMILLAVWLRSVGGRAYQLAIYAWNPLVVVEFAGSAHSDALALAALVGAFVIIKSRPTLSTLLLACAALLKSFPILLFPLWLWRAGWPRSWRAWMNGCAAAALAAICTWPYRAAFHQIPITLATFESLWQDNNASLYTLLKMFSLSHEFAAGIGVGVAVGLAFWTAVRGIEPARAALWIFGAVLIFSPNAYSWYFTWIIPFLCFYPNPAWLLLTVLQFLSYNVLINYQDFGVFNSNPRYLALTYVPFYALLLWQALRKKQEAVRIAAVS